MKQLLIYSLVSFILLVAGITLYTNQNNKHVSTHQTAQKANTEELETYTYKITKVDQSGYYGTSTEDQTGIYFVSENVPKGTKLNEGDTIEVTFPNNSYEEITSIVKID